MTTDKMLKVEYSIKHKLVEKLIMQSMADAQGAAQLLGMDALDFTAVIAATFGSTLACTDAVMDKLNNTTAGDDRSEMHKKTFNVNFDVAYNEHRAMHEHNECHDEPDKKIV